MIADIIGIGDGCAIRLFVGVFGVLFEGFGIGHIVDEVLADGFLTSTGSV